VQKFLARSAFPVRYTVTPGPVRDWWSTNGMGSIVCLAPPMKVSRATITGSSPA
jgi:hypothetical protein